MSQTRIAPHGWRQAGRWSICGPPILTIAAILALAFPAAALAQGSAMLTPGEWRGQYACTQGVTGLTLTISPPSGGAYPALFAFYPWQGRPGVSGSFRTTLTFEPRSGRISAAPKEWVDQPPGYDMVPFEGRVTDGGKVIAAEVRAGGCSTMTVALTGVASTPNAGAPAAQASNPSPRVVVERADGGSGPEVYRIPELRELHPDWKPFQLYEYGSQAPRATPEDLCKVVPPSETADCRLGNQYSPMTIGTDKYVSAKNSLRRICASASATLQKEHVVECLVGSERFNTPRSQNERYTSIKGILQRVGTCGGLIELVYAALERNFSLEANFKGLSGNVTGVNASACKAFAVLRLERGLDAPFDTCGQGTNRGERLSLCLGAAPSSQAFREAITNAVVACEQGGRIALVDRIRDNAAKSGADIDPNLDCTEVKTMALPHGVVDGRRLDEMIRKDEALKPVRKPRDKELQQAFLSAFGASMSCQAERGTTCTLPRGIRSSEALAEAAMNAITDRITASLGQAGASSGDYAIRVRETISLGLKDISMRDCSALGPSRFMCTYNVEVTCQIAGTVRFQGIDVNGSSLQRQVCPAFTLPALRTSAFSWSGGRLTMDGHAFPR